MESLEKDKKVIDQMITAHSSLHDKYKFYSGLNDAFLIGGSAILNGLVFFDFNLIKKYNWFSQSLDKDSFQGIIGIISITIFALSLVSTTFDWKKKAESHNQARIQLTNLKFNARNLISKKTASDEDLKKYSEEYKKVMENLPITVPNKLFNSLKSKHYKKRELSKLIDKYPKTHIMLLKLSLFIAGIKVFFKPENINTTEGKSE